jgi:hypothetical protein
MKSMNSKEYNTGKLLGMTDDQMMNSRKFWVQHFIKETDRSCKNLSKLSDVLGYKDLCKRLSENSASPQLSENSASPQPRKSFMRGLITRFKRGKCIRYEQMVVNVPTCLRYESFGCAAFSVRSSQVRTCVAREPK